MKKLIVMMLSILLLVGLCACGQEAPAEEDMQITAKPKVEETIAVEETAAATEASQEETVPADTAATDLKALAESCIGKDISELYALIGEPASSDYAPSCLVDGKDGMLYYDGFVVYTTREGDVETVYYVE